MVGPGFGRHLLGIELDARRRPYTLGFLPSMAGVLPRNRWAGFLADWHLSADAQPRQVSWIIPRLCTGLVDVRAAQRPYPELDLYWCGDLFAARIYILDDPELHNGGSGRLWERGALCQL